jgi:o-succinylbenzoate synthase
MLKAVIKKHRLKFIRPGTTSRGVLQYKDSWFIVLFEDHEPEKKGIGECHIIPRLSYDDRPDFEEKLNQVAANIEKYKDISLNFYHDFPSIRFGIETALIDLNKNADRILFPSLFTDGQDKIQINGLVWMGSFEDMYKQIKDKLKEGFTCIKLKIGAINFDQELHLIREIRKEFTKEEVVIRTDANGAFSPAEAMEKLILLAELDVHSIEQPIKSGQRQDMADLCSKSPVPIALDEELIGISKSEDKRKLLQEIKPPFLILKPGIMGGLASCKEWVELAKENGTDWWVTSALESNIGLNVVAQWTYSLQHKVFHGLGTGQLFENNIDSPLFISQGEIGYNPETKWNLENIL